MKRLQLLRSAFPLILTASIIHAADPTGALPLGKDGKPLNLDFEDGTLRDWTASGEAFAQQPVKGPIDQNRKYGKGRVANHQGEFWIGGYERVEDTPRGTLTSAKFKVTQPFAAFRFNGGTHTGTRVELVRADSGEVFFKTSGHDSETMLPVVVDLAAVKDREIFIRLVDEVSGGWGHVNFDDFRFYETKPQFAAPKGIGPVGESLAPRDAIRNAGLTPEQAVKEMTLPPGFRATVFAAEPDVKQPIAFAIDDRGRLWVAESYDYPRRAPEGEGKDRIIVLEDKDGDGRHDKRTVFAEKLNLVSGIEVGFGGVWVGSAPNFSFIPMIDGDEPRPAGPPQILLDGWGFQDTHETLNTFTWGPDGWLYGCHGVFTHSNVGKPGAPDSERTKINAGVWRYHPTKHRFEVFAEGTSNPWGIDFNEFGHCVIEACVIPHLFHIVQGGRYHRQAGQHFNPFVFDDIKTIADHVHYLGATPHGGNLRSDSAGGGHAHAGLMIYQGTKWPEQYRGAAFMNNIHGARINMDTLERRGSGYVGKHGADFIRFNDAWSQIVNLQQGPDESVFLIDWYDRQQCHNSNPEAHDRSNGRIFKISYGTRRRVLPMWELDEHSLATTALGSVEDEWRVRHARRRLQERAATGGLEGSAARFLASCLADAADAKPPRTDAERLRALWALHAIGGLGEGEALKLLRSSDEHLRAWAVQLLCEDRSPSDAAVNEFARLARTDPSPVVRLYLASAAQRIDPARRWEIVAALHRRSDDAKDHNLPLMAWYALEPLVVAGVSDAGPGSQSLATSFNRALAIALESDLHRTLEFTTRRIAGLGDAEAMAALAAALSKADDEPALAMLTGISAALKGQRSAPEPKGWDVVDDKLSQSAKREVRALAESLSLTFGSKRALDTARRVVTDTRATSADRLRALDSLLNVKDAALPPVLLALLTEPALRPAALRGLAAYADPKTPGAVLAIYGELPAAEKRDALLTLASRTAFARPLLAAMADGRVAASDVSADIARQIRGLNDADLTQQLEKVWGSARETTADKQAQLAKYKMIVAAKSPPPDASRGRAVFDRTCAQCHMLFGVGGKIGPDITGANRSDLDYLLHNVLDPNAEIPNQYRTATIELSDGRVIAGIANQQDPKVVTIVAGNETLTVPRTEIKRIALSEFSMMPEGLLTPLSDQEVRDLLAYLRSGAQVGLPAGQ